MSKRILDNTAILEDYENFDFLLKLFLPEAAVKDVYSKSEFASWEEFYNNRKKTVTVGDPLDIRISSVLSKVKGTKDALILFLQEKIFQEYPNEEVLTLGIM